MAAHGSAFAAKMDGAAWRRDPHSSFVAISTAFTWGTRDFTDGAGAPARHGAHCGGHYVRSYPRKLLRPDNAPRMIETLRSVWRTRPVGAGCALVLRFDRALSLYISRNFLQRILIERVHVAAIWLVRISVLGIAGQVTCDCCAVRKRARVRR